jgi:hypothetical protein
VFGDIDANVSHTRRLRLLLQALPACTGLGALHNPAFMWMRQVMQISEQWVL